MAVPLIAAGVKLLSAFLKKSLIKGSAGKYITLASKKVFAKASTETVANQILSMSKQEIAQLSKEFGTKAVNEILESAKIELKDQDTGQDNAQQDIEIDTSKRSSWVAKLHWTPGLMVLTVTTLKGKEFKLPFFPVSAVRRIERGASAGKTIWNAYWRKYGKGSVENKANNLLEHQRRRRVSRAINRLAPKITVPTVKNGRVVLKRVVPRTVAKAYTTPGTAAKGITHSYINRDSYKQNPARKYINKQKNKVKRPIKKISQFGGKR